MMPLAQRRNGRNSARNRRRVRRADQRRSLRLEILESRRLLIAQGDSFSFTEDLDTSGLLGEVSAEIRWGDETSSDALVTGGNETGDLQIVFNFTKDDRDFFALPEHQNRRDILQQAADTLIYRFADSLTAVVPAQHLKWSVVIPHPAKNPRNSEPFFPLTLNDPTIAANTIVIYAGSRNFPTANERGQGGFGDVVFPDVPSCPIPCDQIREFQFNAVNRGNTGAFPKANPTLDDITDVAPSFGSIGFDDVGTDWYFDNPAGIQPGQWDFRSFATHELAHALGFGVSPSWARLVQSGSYTGPNANQVFNGTGTVPIEINHWNDSIAEDNETLMIGDISGMVGDQQLFSKLDFAGMKDIGWEVLEMDANVTASHQYNVPGEFVPQIVLRGERAGELVYSLDPVIVTAVTQSLTASFSGAEVSEGSSGGVGLTVVRGDVVTTDELVVTINGGPSGQLDMPATITIPANMSQLTIQVRTVDDDIAELSKELSFTFTAANHESDTIGITVLDDEPPLFQNPNDRFDVSGSDGAKASDALRVINALRDRSSPVLDPEIEQPNGVFYDVNGDYRLTALDALIIINELPNRDSNGASEAMIQIVTPAFIDADKDKVDTAVDASIESGTLF